MDQWGCNSTCVDHFNTPVGYQQIIQLCECPSAIKIAETSTPFSNVTLNNEEIASANTELTTSGGSGSSGAGVQASNGNLDANVNVNGLTSTVLIIFALQLIFCLAICYYTHYQTTKAQKREEEQKA